MENIGNYLKRKPVAKKREGGMAAANAFMAGNAKYIKLQKPLEAAAVCDAARAYSEGRFTAVSFKDGLLTLGIKNSGEAANLQMESDTLIKSINSKLGEEKVKRLRFRIVA